jgi:hypothetical protein
MRKCLIILLFISSVCNAQESVLKIYKLVTDTVHENYLLPNYHIEPTLYGKISKKMIENIEYEKEKFIVTIELKKKYWAYYESITEKLVGSQMAIFFNDELISTPLVLFVIKKGGLNLRLSSKDKGELIYKSLGGKKLAEKSIPDYYNEDFYPNGKLLFEQNVSIDSIFLLYANAVLSTPDNHAVNKRNDILNEIMDWFLKNSKKEYLLGEKPEREKNITPNSYTLKIGCADTIKVGDEKKFIYEQSIVVYYIVCLTKAITENRNLSDTEAKIKATEYLIEYIFQKTNYTESNILPYKKIEQSEFLKSLKNRENIRRAVENID